MCLLPQLSSPTSLPGLQVCAPLQPACSMWCFSAQAAARHSRSARWERPHRQTRLAVFPGVKRVQKSMPPAGTVHEPPIMRLPYDPQNMRLPKLVGAKAFTILSWNVNSIKTLLNKVGSLAEVEACRWCHAPKSLPEALPVACGLIVYHRCCPCLSHSRLGWLYLLSHGCLAVQLQATTLLRLEGAWLVRPNGACITLCALAL